MNAKSHTAARSPWGGSSRSALGAAIAGLLVSALLVLGAPVRPAHAQDAPDLRSVPPVVMLLVDTSGSMERMPDGDSLPMCSGSTSGQNEQNRWALLTQALTGSWSNYYCTTRTREIYTNQPDFNYYLPYNEPPLTVVQNNDGILDAYLDRVRFGLMTFDSTYTYRDAPFLMAQTAFRARENPDNPESPGGFSYGTPRPLTYPGCATTFMVDSGARNEDAPAGALVSVGTDADDVRVINQRIQSQLLAVRPYGGTPTAALLYDYQHYLNNHPDVRSGGDPYYECRSRYAILLTDGAPDEDFRDARYNCEGTNGCPYPTSSQMARDLCQYNGTTQLCEGPTDGLFVVAFNVNDNAAIAELNDVAQLGGTDQALLATNRTELLNRISTILDRAAPGTTTRTVPSFVRGGSTFSNGQAVQHQFNAGFRVGTDTRPWSGVLERTRYTCDAALNVVEQPIDSGAGDEFHTTLNQRDLAGDPRRLLTVVTSDPDDMMGNIIGQDAQSLPLGATSLSDAVTGERLEDFETSNSNLTAAHFGITTGTVTERTDAMRAVINWVHGTSGTARDGARFGDIYHSSPVSVGPPRADIADESYNLFRQRPEVAERPTVIYVGTNDGILHAFAAEDHRLSNGTQIEAGEELWGFVPPVLVQKLQSATASHQFMVDATPVVRDVFYRRLPGQTPDGDLYHTVLIMGLRAGGAAYFALDVTDPLNPRFLWQFSNEQAIRQASSSGGTDPLRDVTGLGPTFARPAVGQVLVEINGTLQERAVALLPGGAGTLDEARVAATNTTGCSPQGSAGQAPLNDGVQTLRSNQRCWGRLGRTLTWLDVVSGEIIQTFDHTTINAPMTGGVSLYPGEIGSIATRAFMTDDDGMMWRADFGNINPNQWSVELFHDIFHGGDATTGQPGYEPPIITTDAEGNVVVIQATGNVDQLASSALNRIVSLTENVTVNATTGESSWTAAVNWEVRFQAGEQVTGPLQLFDGTVYFGTFRSTSDPNNQCAVGEGRLWAVDFADRASILATGYTNPIGRFPAPRFESTPGSGTFDAHFLGPFANEIVMGVGITQRPSCIEGTTIPDPYIGPRFRVTNTGGGQFSLVANLSGGTGSSSAGGSVRTITRTLPAPASETRIQAWTTDAD